MINTLTIGKRQIGSGQPCFIIAEAGPNHNADINIAKRLVDAAREAGADAVKFQTANPMNVASDTTPKAIYQQKTTGTGGSMLDMIKSISLEMEDFAEIKQYCDETGIMFLSTPFDLESVDFLVSLGMPAIKIPSGEINNPFLLRKAAQKKLPMMLSTGMAQISEIATAIELLRAEGCTELALFQCVSCYPTEPDAINLRTIPVLSTAFGVPCGFSDHSLGIDLATASVAIGASLVEKHFTLDRTMPGPDHAMSLEPNELAKMVSAIRRVERALGDGAKRPQPDELEVRDVARRSLAARRNIQEGATITMEDLFALRPATGMSPMLADTVVGRKAVHLIPARTLITPDDLA